MDRKNLPSSFLFVAPIFKSLSSTECFFFGVFDGEGRHGTSGGSYPDSFLLQIIWGTEWFALPISLIISVIPLSLTLIVLLEID